MIAYEERERVLTLEEALELGRDHIWLQMRWWPEAQAMRYAGENLPWLKFREFSGERTVVTVKGEEYGKSWRCFDLCPVDEKSFPWSDGKGGWVPEDGPEAGAE